MGRLRMHRPAQLPSGTALIFCPSPATCDAASTRTITALPPFQHPHRARRHPLEPRSRSTPYRYDFSTVRNHAGRRAAPRHPANLGPVPLRLPRRPDAAAPAVCPALCARCAAPSWTSTAASGPDDTLIVTPINEVSFMSWLGGDASGTVALPPRPGLGREVWPDAGLHRRAPTPCARPTPASAFSPPSRW
ncbi:MAG: hypothetical protein WKG07_30875 [Hymenobacter sp.]